MNSEKRQENPNPMVLKGPGARKRLLGSRWPLSLPRLLGKRWLLASGCLAALALALLALEPGAVYSAPPHSAVKTSIVLKVGNKDEAADAIVSKVESLEGYFSIRTEESLVLKVPVDEVEGLLVYAETLGTIIDRSYESRDVGTQLEQLKAKLEGRQSVLKRYFDVLKKAGPNGILEVEREITHMVAEIEGLKGNIRLLQHQLDFAEITVAFQFKDRSAPARDGRSSFYWLNTMNLVDLVNDFRSGQ